jgi:hypothetical protein
MAGVIELSCCALEHKAALDHWLGRSSASALEPNVSVLNAQNFPFMLQFLDLLYFLQNA